VVGTKVSDGTTSALGRSIDAMKPVEARLIKAQMKARRALVIKNMFDLMDEMGQGDKFKNPDAWMDSITERPRPPAHSSPGLSRRRRTASNET
jgi:hypothetical protein